MGRYSAGMDISRETVMRTILAAAALGLAPPVLSGCNTVAGLGEDVQAVGDGVTRAAQHVEREVFDGSRQTSARPVRYAERGEVRVGEACDPNASEVSGGNLPPCRAVYSREPGPRN